MEQAHEQIVLSTINRLFDEEEMDVVFTDEVDCAISPDVLTSEQVDAAFASLQASGAVVVEVGSGMILSAVEHL